jgi:VanZ family protein
MFNIQFKKYPVSCFLIAVIWYLSLFFNAPKTPFDSMQLIDKWVHFVMYGGTFGVLWIEYLRQHSRANFTKLFVWAWVAPILMSGIIELIQEYCTEKRNGDWIDLMANAIGVTLAAIAGTVVTKMRKKQ